VATDGAGSAEPPSCFLTVSVSGAWHANCETPQRTDAGRSGTVRHKRFPGFGGSNP
jgi:hypothetical protein